MPDLAFVLSSGQPLALRELVATLRHELERQGIPSTEHADGFPRPRSDLVYVLVDPRTYVKLEGPDAIPDQSVLRRTMLLGAERPDQLRDDDHLELLRQAGVVFDIDQRAVAAMHRLGVPARALKPGYSDSLDRFDADRHRPIDVMFLGAHSLRRTEHLRRCARVLSRHNCLLHFSDSAASAVQSPTYLADGRWPLLAATKVLVNLHRDDDDRFEWMRAVDAIHAGAVVVSEHSSGLVPLEPGRHLLLADGDALPYVLDTILRDESRLAAIRAEAYERLRSWMPFALSASIFRATVVEILGRPLIAGASLGRPGGPRPDPAPAESDRDMLDIRRELHDARTELVEVRRQLGAVRARLVPRPAVEILHQSPAWAARRVPRVTILTAMLDDAPQVVATLDSVAGSWMSDHELVIVDAGSGDDSRRVASEWLESHPRLPARLIADRAAQGRGAARNTGLDFARARSCLILDPGCALYAHGLQRLADTLDALPEVVAVYPMIEVVGPIDWFIATGGDYLLNTFAWEPGRLRGGNLVHAPYLIRTGALRELGGFATEVSLLGFEDYALWCAVAERGLRPQLVAQLLARRALLADSSLPASLRPSRGPATRALCSSAPLAMAGAFPPV